MEQNQKAIALKNQYKEETLSLMQCSAKQEVIPFVKIERGLTIEAAMKGDNIQKLLKIQDGEKYVMKALFGIIMMTQEYFSIKQKMNETQAIQTASLLIESYPAETIEDYVMCFKKAKMGEYGTIYNRIDGQIIMDWFKLYLDEKYSLKEQILHNEKISYQNLDVEEVVDARNMIGFKDILEAIQTNKKENTVNKKSEMTDLEHFEGFKTLVNLYSLKELKQLKSEYERKERESMWTKYTQYIELLDFKINEKEKQ